MATIIKTHINFKYNENLLSNLLKVHKDSPLFKDALLIAGTIKSLIKPKFILKKCETYKVCESTVGIDYISFNSKTFAEKLNKSTSLFMFAATGGKEIEFHADDLNDYFEKYVINQIAYMGCLSALESMREVLKNTYGINNYITLAPGSLSDWDVIETKQLYELMGEDYKKIGIRVLDSGMVEPINTVSGVIFESEDTFSSCELCMRANCPTRFLNHVN